MNMTQEQVDKVVEAYKKNPESVWQVLTAGYFLTNAPTVEVLMLNIDSGYIYEVHEHHPTTVCTCGSPCAIHGTMNTLIFEDIQALIKVGEPVIAHIMALCAEEIKGEFPLGPLNEDEVTLVDVVLRKVKAWRPK